MDIKDAHKRLLAAQKILEQDTTTRAKFESIRTLIKGLNPTIDKSLAECSKALKTVDKIQQGQVIQLTVEKLPEDTEQNKKRKKALLLLLRHWKQLTSEVIRLQKELSHQSESQTQTKVQQASSWGRILHFAKGPLGIITILAAAAVYLNSASPEIIITNQGCDPINPKINIPVSLPGLKLPNQPINSGDQATVVLPPLKLNVDGTNPKNIKLTALGISMNFELNNPNIDLLFNGQSLIGQQTQIRLGEQNTHELIINCN